MVEFAVVLPLLLIIVFGILYFGRYEGYSTQITQLAEQGARDAAVDYPVPSGTSANGTACGTTNIACFIASQASGELAAGSSDVAPVSVFVDCNSNISGNTAACSAGNNVTVCLQSRVQFPALGLSAGTVYQQATMRIETAGAAQTTYTPTGGTTPSC
jgi:Flp pilus assembly protein TadG